MIEERMAASNRTCDVVSEFGSVSLGDSRLDARLVRIVELSAASPSASFLIRCTRTPSWKACIDFSRMIA